MEERLQPNEVPCVRCGATAQEQIIAVVFKIEDDEVEEIPPALTNGYHCRHCNIDFLSPEQEAELAESLEIEAYAIIYIEEV
ncbi:MAG TPA: hypothetical protein VIH52_04495 [Candidatus Nanoarchaeia archaeon]